MGRRPSLLDPPACPRAGHGDTLVTLGGTYGTPPRQMFWCKNTDGKVKHRFAGVLPRLIADGAVCQHCDNAVHRHEGPLLTRDYEFHLRLAAKALIDVGTGLTYTEAAARARATAGRGAYNGAEPNGVLVAEWMDVLGGLLVREHAATSWPETTLIDSTNFIINNKRMGTSAQAFAIIAAYGYHQSSKRGQLLGFYATHEHLTTDYVDALGYFEALGNQRSGATGRWAPPRMLLTDGESALVAGIRQYWKAGTGPSCGTGTAPYAKRCEWHLRKNARKAMGLAGVGDFDHPMRPLLDVAFTDPTSWAAFSAAAQAFPKVAGYVKRNDKQVTDQVARRATLPQHHSIAALEQVLERLRPKLERRAFTFRNQRRMNLLLGLMRNHELRVDDLDHYTEVLREAAKKAGGRIAYQRQGYCLRGAYDLRP